MLDIGDQKLLLILSFFGGLGLILVGLKHLSNSLQTLFSRTIEWFINFIDESPIKAVYSGLGVSMFVQSGITTTIMAVSYAGSGLLSLNQMLAFLLGSNLGTVFTPWLFTLDAKTMSFYLLGMSSLPMLYFREERLHALSQFVFSLGLMLLGYHFMDLGILDPFMLRAVIESAIGSLDWSPYLYYSYLVIFFVLCSLLVRSSVAMIAILMLLVYKEVIPDIAGIIGVLGVNFGASLPVLFSTFKSGTRAKRGAFFHVLTQLLTLLLVTIIFESFWEAVVNTVNWLDVFVFQNNLGFYKSFVMVPLSHLYFNVLLVTFSLIMFKPIKWVVETSVRGKVKKEPQRLKLLGQIIHSSPSLALEQAHQEVKKMSAMVATIFQLVHNIILEDENTEEESKVNKYEAITDNIQKELLSFLENIMELSLVEKQGRKVREYLRITDELESIADNCKSIYERFNSIKLQNGTFDEGVKNCIKPYLVEVLTYYESVFTELTSDLEDSTYSKAELINQGKLLKEKQAQVIKEVFKLSVQDEMKISASEIVLSLGLIRAQSKNIIEVFNT